MDIRMEMTLQEKLHILVDAAKYDVACTSSGADRRGRAGFLGNSAAEGICHSFASDGRCISLLKILLTNHCVYDCRYCINRSSNDIVRTAFTPREVCDLTVEFYKRNYIEGLFLSSGVWKNPAYTMERICETLSLLRGEYRFNGYIHVKAIPGAPDELLAAAGYLADRMSINLELATADGLRRLAPNKSHRTILRPMRMMSDTIAGHRLAAGKSMQMERSASSKRLPGSIFSEGQRREKTQDRAALMDTPVYLPQRNIGAAAGKMQGQQEAVATGDSGRQCFAPTKLRSRDLLRPFAPAGQSTQMIVGAIPETDYHLLKTAQYLYQTYDLKRVFFSAYVPLNADSGLPVPGTPPPLLREHRLYQADWLLRFYGFQADELLSEQHPDFNAQLDPKCDWALRHPELFPVEVNTADYGMILRIPGIGPKSALRIMQARRYGRLDFPHLKKMGVVLKRAHYFITCNGRMMYATPPDKHYIIRQLSDGNARENWQIMHQNENRFRQLSLFDDFQLQA